MNKSTFKRGMLGLLLTMFLVTFSQAQQRATIFGKKLGEEYINPVTGKIQCVSYQYMEYLNDLELPNPVARVANEVQDYQETNDVMIIPVVVHIIHSGEQVGVGKNISEARILSQIQVLNEDFRKMAGTSGDGSNPLGVDTQIQFCLAKRDPQGNATNGINRVNLGNSTAWNMLNVEGILKPQTQWDPTKYFNIWVCEFGYHSNPNYDLEGVLGYAQFPSNSTLPGIPSTGQSNTDGVVIDWRCFGRATQAPGSYYNGYNRGRTTTHEVGHALGLRHIWGDNTSCTVNTNDSQQDYCLDTPPHRNPNGSCFATSNTTCSGYTPMPENYMDYGTDNCLNTFTNNQKTRMRTALSYGTRRSTLLTSGVCEPPASTDKFELGMISLYPNPTSDILNLVVPDNYDLEGNITVFNALGQKMYSSLVSGTNMHSIDVSNFAQGAYFVKIDRENQTKTLQFIKK